ncbi:MAG: hypothetical protein WCW54_00715 [Candidatus Paceibacterota bacterium]|jgi:hypothetical protein
MKKNILKNLIALGIFAILAVSYHDASAAVYYSDGYYNNGYSTSVTDLSTPSYYNNSINSNYVRQPYTYVYAQPTTTQIQYVPQQQTVQYVPQQQVVQYAPQQQTVRYVTTGNTQGASVINANTTTTTIPTATGNKGNTGQYVNFDANRGYSNNMMVASAYQPYATQQVDTNGVTALSLKGSGSFLPSSLFQWIMFILLVLAIIVVARMVAKKSAANNAHTVVVH